MLIKYFKILLLLTFTNTVLTSQNTEAIDKHYREDQFYVGVTYNVLSNRPANVTQTGFSTGFHFGVIRDMPINSQRNMAFGLGLGLSTNSYNQNVLIQEVNNEIVYGFVDETLANVTRNKFTTYLIELPFEFRWRTSTATNQKFWRIYSGFKLGYMVYNSSKHKSDTQDILVSNIEGFNRFQYGVTLSLGYGTWNLHAYYGLNNLFDKATTLNGTSIAMRSLKLGLMFYIL